MMLRKLTFPFRMSRHLRGYGGAWGFLKGAVRLVGHYVLWKKYVFDRWHISPIEWRVSTLEACRYMNNLVKREKLQTVVEIGCGLGEILARIRTMARTGFDIDSNVIRAARRTRRGIVFHVGSFDDVEGMEIGLLVAIGFMHNIPGEKVQRMLRRIVERNRIRFMVLEMMRGQYFHDFEPMIGPDWERIWESREYVPDRRVLCFRNTKLSETGTHAQGSGIQTELTPVDP